MAIWRKKTVRHLLNGKRCPAGTRGAVRHVEESKRFYGTLRMSDGRTRQVPLSEDRDASRQLLRAMQTEEDRAKALGIGRKEREQCRPLAAHLADYERHLRSKRSTERYVAQTMSRLRAVLAAIGAKTVAELDAGRISHTLADWRCREDKPLGTQTTNHYVRAVKAFSRWLYVEARTSDESLRSLRTLNVRADIRRPRRPFSPDELRRLVSATRDEGVTRKGLPAEDRAMLYAVAAYTGLRASELASLTPESFDLDAMTVTVRAAYSKRRRDDVLPLHQSLVSVLRPWLASKEGSLWPGRWAAKRLATEFLRRDLAAAEIPYRDGMGRFADFHALRHTFITSLARSGVHPKDAQTLARHSDINLTMNAYSHIETEAVRTSLNAIPAIA